MRAYEFLNEALSDFPGIPSNRRKYYDDESGLYLNAIQQWSLSPYLGAVDAKNGKFKAQIHIPQDAWQHIIQDNEKWRGHLPPTFFNDAGQNRSTIQIQGFSDPRQAAWLVQTILYGTEDTNELIDDYLTVKYIEGHNGITAWRDILRDMPTFDGRPMDEDDADEWLQNATKRNKAARIAINTNHYAQEMPSKIIDAFTKALSNKPARRKVLGNAKYSLNKVKDIVQNAINQLGIEYFVTSPGSIKLKDPLSFDLSTFS